MLEEVACTYADIEVFGAGALFEEGEEDAGGGAAPDIGLGYAEDPDIVEEAEEKGQGVDGCTGSSFGFSSVHVERWDGRRAKLFVLPVSSPKLWETVTFRPTLVS